MSEKEKLLLNNLPAILMAVRQACLLLVDAIEISLGISPTTAEARKACKPR